ncbi:hypothetical protein FHS96_005139 [Sphingomonas zeicaulis]|uniref:hypothetical protein n=1 Tax=Sphingomonas zeicaulis TaxID=1632740 RepID=UPI003D1F8830
MTHDIRIALTAMLIADIVFANDPVVLLNAISRPTFVRKLLSGGTRKNSRRKARTPIAAVKASITIDKARVGIWDTDTYAMWLNVRVKSPDMATLEAICCA